MNIELVGVENTKNMSKGSERKEVLELQKQKALNKGVDESLVG